MPTATATSTSTMSPTLLHQNQSAPEFSLKDQDGRAHRLEDYKGKWLLLYFYPKDDTSGCTTEACGLRDAIKRYEEKNCVVLGVSADTIESHKTFSGKLSLPFPLLADTGKSVMSAYGVWGEKAKEDGTKYMGIRRMSFLIDPNGTIAKIYPNVDPELHADEVLKDLELLQSPAAH